jgi:phosphohistidine phosphatase
MKTLFLVRHAKPDNEDESLPERERPLSHTGLMDAQGMAERLARRGVRPDALVSSPAAHARRTAEVFAKRFGHGADAVVIDERLYETSPDALVELVRHLDERLATVMVVGHKEVGKLAEELSAGQVASMPVCAVAELQFEVARWPQLGEQPAATVRFDDRKKRG